MKLRLLILLAAAALAAAPAAGQTIKSLGFNTSNGVVPTTALSNLPLTFTNTGGISGSSFDSGNVLINSNTVTFYGTNSGLAFSAGANASQVRNQIGLGATWLTNTNVTNFRTEIGLGASSSVQFDAITTASIGVGIGATSIFTVDESTIEVALPIEFALGSAAGTRTNLGLGATNAVTFSNITASGSLTATGNATLSGVNNTMPNATNAASASSLMTRDLVGQEFANPRNKMQTTYWFGLEGLGLWQVVNGANASVVGNRGPRCSWSLGVFGNTTNNRSAVTAAGFGLRLGANNITGLGAWRPSDGGAFVLRTQAVNYYGNGNLAVGFYMGPPANTNFWGNSDAIGIWCVAQPTNSWVSNTAFVQHTRIAISNVVWTVSTAGTTDTNQPTWTDLINSTVTNGTAVFRNLGPHTSNNWVLARGSTNASEVVMTNTGKSNWARPTGQEALLKLRYGTNTAAPYTYFATVTDGAGESAEVSIDGLNNNAISPQYWGRWDSTNAGVGSDSFGIRYFSIDAELPPPTTP